MLASKMSLKAPRLSAAPAAPRRMPLPTMRISAHKPQQPQHQQEQEHEMQNFAALPLAGLLAAALMAAPLVSPGDALAARTSGRAGGSSGFSSRKMAPSPRMEAAPQYRSSSTNIVVAPSPYAVAPSPFGFSPFGGFGFHPFGIGYGVGVGFPVFGGLFSFLALALTVSVVFNVIKSVASSGGDGGSKKDRKDGDGWGDL